MIAFGSNRAVVTLFEIEDTLDKPTFNWIFTVNFQSDLFETISDLSKNQTTPINKA